jgi:hypothetical protein
MDNFIEVNIAADGMCEQGVQDDAVMVVLFWCLL